MLGVLWAAALLILQARVPEFTGPPEPPPLRPGAAAISGRVLDSVSEKPVAGLEVRLIEVDPAVKLTGPRQQPTRTTRTNSRGEFSFTKFGSGTYGILVTGKTHLMGCLGSTRESVGPCPPIHLDDDLAQRDANIFVRPAAVLRGRVVDQEARPVNRAGVRLATPDRPQEIAGAALSDADGRFEIGGLAPGLVTLTVEMPGGNGAGLVRAYYPGVTREYEAQPIAIDLGEAAEIEMRMPRLTIGSINARISGPNGFVIDTYVLRQPATKMRLMLSTVDEGAASVPNLREGRYVIEARATANGKLLAAFAPVDVSDGEAMAALQLEDAAVITGRIVAERGGVPPIGDTRVASVWMLDGGEVDPTAVDTAAVSADGAFSFERLFGSRLFKVIGLDPAWRVVSIRAGRADITDSPFDLAPGSRTELTITVGRQ